MRLGSVDEKALITTILISFCHWKTFVPLCLQKSLFWKRVLTLIVNYRKIVQKNKLCHPKQQQIGYLMIHDVIHSLLFCYWKIGVFQQTVLWQFHTFLFKWTFFEKLKTSVETCLLHNRSFINSLVGFYIESKITEHLFK